MSQNFRPTRAEVNLQRFKANLEILKKKIEPGAFFCPMIKANAYGHGISLIGNCLEQMRLPMGVALVEEALQLREAGVRSPIYFFGTCNQDGASELIRQKVIPMISNLDMLQSFLKAAFKAQTSLDVHLKLNTGMNRLGLASNEAITAAEQIKKESSLKVKGIMTHFYSAAESADCERQIAIFQPAASAVEKILGHTTDWHLGSSGSLLHYPKSKIGDRIFGSRPGLAMYGIDPLGEKDFGLKPVLRLMTEVVQIREVQRGETVSYGARWKAAKKSEIAVVPCGYGDGYPRDLSQPRLNKGVFVYLPKQGVRAQIAGTICMDSLMLDVTGCGVKPGDPVELLGEHIRVEDLADAASTIAYELYTGISARVPRVSVDEAD